MAEPIAKLIIYTDLPYEVRPGAAPDDQGPLIAQLTADLATMTADRDALVAKIANAVAAAQAAKDADAANVEGQAVLDALA